MTRYLYMNNVQLEQMSCNILHDFRLDLMKVRCIESKVALFIIPSFGFFPDIPQFTKLSQSFVDSGFVKPSKPNDAELIALAALVNFETMTTLRSGLGKCDATNKLTEILCERGVLK